MSSDLRVVGQCMAFVKGFWIWLCFKVCFGLKILPCSSRFAIGKPYRRIFDPSKLLLPRPHVFLVTRRGSAENTGAPKKPYFEYYCRVVAILPSGSLSRVSRKVQARFLGDEGGVTRLSYPTRIFNKKQTKWDKYESF